MKIRKEVDFLALVCGLPKKYPQICSEFKLTMEEMDAKFTKENLPFYYNFIDETNSSAKATKLLQ